MKKLYITADFNDGDYGHVLIEVSEEVFNKFKPLIDAINNFQPYIMRSDFGIDHHNWNSAREDLGEISLYEKYSQFEKDYIDEFSQIFIDPIPVHCCGSEDQPPHTIVSLKDVITDEEYIVETSYSDLTKRYSPKTVEYLKERDRLGSYKRESDGKDIYSIPFSEMTKEEEELLDKIKNLWKKYTVDNSDEKEEIKCVDSFKFSVLCTSSKQVEEVLNCKRRNKKVRDIFQFTEEYYYWSQVCLQNDLNDLEEGEYGYEYQGGHSNDWLRNQYDNGDLSGYENALFKKGHSILITFKVEDGRAYDWVWDDLFNYTIKSENLEEKLGIILSYSDFNSLIESIEKDSFYSLTNSLVSSFQITKTIFNIDPEEENSNYERHDKLLENAKEDISSPDFIQDLGNFIKINGLGYNFLIRKSTINCIKLHTVYVNEDNIDNFDKLDIGELVGNEVLIYLAIQEQPIRIHFIVDSDEELYEDELAELCYSRLMNEIDWNV